MYRFLFALTYMALLCWLLPYVFEGGGPLSLLRCLKDTPTPGKRPPGNVSAALSAIACRYVRSRYASPYRPVLRIWLADVWVVAGTLFFGLNLASHILGTPWTGAYQHVLLVLFLADFAAYAMFLGLARRGGQYPSPTAAEMNQLNAFLNASPGNIQIPRWWFLGSRMSLVTGFFWVFSAGTASFISLLSVAALFGWTHGTPYANAGMIIDGLGITLLWTASVEARVRGSLWMGCANDTYPSFPLKLALRDMSED